MNNKSQENNNKQRELIKQQLMAMSNSKSTASSSKVKSADSMIEDLLSKKETFQRKDNKTPQNITAWLIPGSGNVHPLYERVWTSVQSNAPHLADTPRLSTLLMTSGLPTEVLGFIWSLANHTVVGALTQQELYVVLALVALAQSGYTITTPAVLNQLPQPPLPKLDFTIISLSTISSKTTPSLSTAPPNISFKQLNTHTIAPLSASSLLDAKPVSSLPPPVINANSVVGPEQEMFISYVSNSFPGSQVTPVGNQASVYPGAENHSSLANCVPPSQNDTSTYITPDMLSLKVNSLTVQGTNDDDDFTDFQTADFRTHKFDTPKSPTDMGDDDFSTFQSVSLDTNYKNNTKENILSTVFSVSLPSESIKSSKNISDTTVKPLFYLETLETKTEKPESIQNISKSEKTPELCINEVEDRYSIFHNPLPELLDDKYSVFASLNSIENQEIVTSEKEGINTLNVLELPTVTSFDAFSNIDDEYSDFHSFDDKQSLDINKAETVNIKQPSQKYVLNLFDNPLNSLESIDENMPDNKLPKVNFDLFQQSTTSESSKLAFDKPILDPDEQFADFQSGSFLKDTETDTTQELFSDFKSADIGSDSSSIIEKDPTIVSGEVIEDKYSALRILQPPTEDSTNDFSEFHGVSSPPVLDNPPDDSIQLRCLDACLTLLKDGLTHLSLASSPEVLAEVLSDSRTLHYLDCLQEVNKMSERILENMDKSLVEKQVKDLETVREKLVPYFSQSQYTNMNETKGTVCGLCRSDSGPCPIKYGLCTFHAPCANLYLHCIDSVLPNITIVK